MTEPAADAAATEAVIHRYYDAFNRGDVDGMLALVADDVVTASPSW